MKPRKTNRLLALGLCLFLLLSVLPLDRMAYAAGKGCNHVHDDSCGHAAAVEGQPCDMDCAGDAHEDGCGHVAAMAEQPCTHQHNNECGGLPQEDTQTPADSEVLCAAAEGCTLAENHEGDCRLALAVNGARNGTIDNNDYAFDPNTGELAVKTDAGTTAWRDDTGIAVEETGRYEAVQSVVFDDSVTSIGKDAFAGCTSLAKLTFQSATAPTIGGTAFNGVVTTGTIYYPAGASSEYTTEWKNGISGLSGWSLASLLTLEVTYNNGATMADAIQDGLPAAGVGKEQVTGIKITGNATAVTGDNWKALYDLYKNDSGWTNLSALDLSGMTELTTIGDISFYNTNVPKLVEVKLPDSLTTIGEGAFNRCTGIRLTALPDGVDSIGQYAFGFCTKLALTKLPDKVTSIGIAAFRDCTGIKLSALPDGVDSIGQYAFSGCIGITLSALPDGVDSIGDSAFSGCIGITLSALPDGVDSIGNSAFAGCIGITLSALPDGVDSIGTSAFAGCTGIRLTALPDGVESIGDNAFTGCTGIRLTALPDGVESIGKYAFDGCTGITEMTFPEKLTSIGTSAFSGCTSLSKLTFQSATAPTIEGTAFNGVATTGTVYYPAAYASNWLGVSGLPGGWTLASLITLEVPYNDGATMADAIQDALLAAGVGKEQVTGIKITGNATAVTGDNWKALYDLYKNDSGWTNLSALHLSEMTALTTIGDMPSYSPGIPKLKQVKLPDSLTTIGDDAFAGGTNLALTALPDGVESIGTRAFSGCTGIRLTALPDGVESIGGNAFTGCIGIRLTALPDGVESIGAAAFSGCTGIRLTALPDGVESIGDAAFTGCTGIRLTALPDGVESIGESAFSGCTGITEMTFPEKLTSIGAIAFSGCTSLDKLTFQSATAPTIGSSAFDGVATTGTIYYRAGYAPNWLAGSGLPGGWTHVLIYQLTVENGTDTTKASFYPEGGQAVIEADAAPGGKAFDRWETLGGGRFLNAASASTTFTMPAADTIVRATYRSTTPAPGPANAGISPDKATFDRYPSGKNHRDIPVTLSPGSHTLNGIGCGNVTLQAGRDYTVSGSRYTFSRTYLATLGKGTHAFIFDMSGGADPTFTLTVEDTRPGGGTSSGPTSDSGNAGSNPNTGVADRALLWLAWLIVSGILIFLLVRCAPRRKRAGH